MPLRSPTSMKSAAPRLRTVVKPAISVARARGSAASVCSGMVRWKLSTMS
jgi:hypothetical protein